MYYYSLNNKSNEVNFKEAIFKGMASDGGLYFPKFIKPIEPEFYHNIINYSNVEIALRVIKQFIDELGKTNYNVHIELDTKYQI